MTSPATFVRYLSAFEETAENAASDSFGSNFSGAAFGLTQPIGGLLIGVLINYSLKSLPTEATSTIQENE